MAGRVLQTDWKRIGRSGPTVDGRVIPPEAVVEMAASYDKSLFTALIWPEHQRYFNMGSVEALRAEKNDEGGMDLFAIISPNQYYLGANASGQKLFSSMEITLDFRKTGKAYLTGLGATDDPASAATSEIRLSKIAGVTGAVLTKTVEVVDTTISDVSTPGFAERVFSFFSKTPEGTEMADKAAIEKLSAELAELKALFVKLPADKAKDEAKPEEQFAALVARLEKLETKFSAAPDAKADEVDAFKVLNDKIEAFGKQLEDALKEQPGTKTEEFSGAGDAEMADIF